MTGCQGNLLSLGEDLTQDEQRYAMAHEAQSQTSAIQGMNREAPQTPNLDIYRKAYSLTGAPKKIVTTFVTTKKIGIFNKEII